MLSSPRSLKVFTGSICLASFPFTLGTQHISHTSISCFPITGHDLLQISSLEYFWYFFYPFNADHYQGLLLEFFVDF